MATTPQASSSGSLQSLQTAFERLSPRERTYVIVAAWVIVLGLLWWLALGPALQILRQAPAQHAAVDAQLANVRTMAATAEAVRSQNTTQPLTRADALRALETATAALGQGGQLNAAADRPTVTLREVAPDALALWLAQVRLNARLTPAEAQLTASGQPVRWSGNVVLAGPALDNGN